MNGTYPVWPVQPNVCEEPGKAQAVRAREIRMIARGVFSTDHPILAHIIPIRRCNLSCAYCNEYDDFSKPVPIELVCQRLDHLADLGTTIITISGGEPLLHPELDRSSPASAATG